jgi:hypothetical protein
MAAQVRSRISAVGGVELLFFVDTMSHTFRSGKSKMRKVVTCKMSVRDELGHIDMENCAVGEAILHPKDKFDLDKGCDIAFKKALEEFKEKAVDGKSDIMKEGKGSKRKLWKEIRDWYFWPSHVEILAAIGLYDVTSKEPYLFGQKPKQVSIAEIADGITKSGKKKRKNEDDDCVPQQGREAKKEYAVEERRG